MIRDAGVAAKEGRGERSEISRDLRGLNAEDFLTTCGRDVALFTDDAYVLGPAVDGKAEWLPLGLIRNQFKGGRLFEIDDGVLAFGARGEVQRVHCSP